MLGGAGEVGLEGLLDRPGAETWPITTATLSRWASWVAYWVYFALSDCAS